jgi:tRNA(Ile2) C34 agmatinyltransferase TiaS
MTSVALDNVIGSRPDISQLTHAEQAIEGLCDSCGTKASYKANKNGFHLNFCGHHVRKNSASLIDRGFSISPDDYQLKL